VNKREYEVAERTCNALEEQIGKVTIFHNVNNIEDVIIEFQNGITIEACKLWVETIAGPKEVDAYVVTGSVMVCNYPHEPDDVDTYEIGRVQGIANAIAMAATEIVTERVTSTCFNVGEAMAFE